MNTIYYKELKKFNTLSNEKIKDIYHRYESGDENAINEMIEGNLKFAVLIAKRYYQTVKSENIIEMDDLISEANIGLILAAKKFNPSLGVKFSTYAVFWIMKQIQLSIKKNNSNIRIPINLYESDRKILKAISELFQKTENEITKSEIEALDLFSKNEIDHFFTNKHIIRIDSTFEPSDENIEINFDDNAEMKRKINVALKHLTPKEKIMIEMTFGINQEPASPNEIWDVLGVTRARAWQLKTSALEKLNNILKGIEI